MKRKQGRRFVKNRATGKIAVQSTSSHRAPLSEIDAGTVFDAAGLLDALIEVKEMLSPTFAQDRVPPELTIAFLADAMYALLTGESEIPTRKLRVTLCEFILTAWSSGSFTPSPAFPYSFEQGIAPCSKSPPGKPNSRSSVMAADGTSESRSQSAGITVPVESGRCSGTSILPFWPPRSQQTS